MNHLMLILLITASTTAFGRMVEENMDDALDFSMQKPVESKRGVAGDSKDDKKKKRNVASDEIEANGDVKYWKFKP